MRPTPLKILFILFSLFSLPATAGAQTSETRSAAVFHIGVSSRTFETVNRNDAAAALKSWAATVMREQNLLEQVEVKFYDAFEDLAKAFRQNRVHAVSTTVEECMLLGVEPEKIFLPATEKGPHVRYAIIVHRDGDITGLDGLMSRKLVTHQTQRMVLAQPWLEALQASQAARPVNRSLGNLTTVENASKSILQVFFRQAHAALVTEDAFALAGELNPQLRKDLRVLAMSSPFITSFFMFRPTWQGQSRERMEAAIMGLHTTPGGRQVLTVFQSSRMETQPGSILDPTRQFLAEYLRLKQYTLSQGAKP